MTLSTAPDAPITDHREVVGGVVINRSDDGAIYARYETLPAASPGPNDLLVRPAFVGICGSDMEQLHGRMPDSFVINFPHTMGHEWSGTVVAVGEQVTEFAVGDRVLGHGHLGDNNWFGVTHDGAMSDTFVVPAQMCFAVPDTVTLKTAAVIEPFACVLQALTKIGGLNPSHTLHVYGLGAIGLSAVVQGVTVGATVVAFDPSPRRQELALELGATAAIDPLSGDPQEAALQATGRALGDVVIEASGVPAAQATALASADDNGRVLLMGVSTPRPVPALLGLVQQRNLMVTSSTGAPVDIWPATIRYVEKARIDLEPFVSSVLTFEDCEEAIRRAQDSSTEVKVLLTSSSGA